MLDCPTFLLIPASWSFPVIQMFFASGWHIIPVSGDTVSGITLTLLEPDIAKLSRHRRCVSVVSYSHLPFSLL